MNVRTQDGRSVRLVVQQVDGETLVSRDGTRYRRSDIAQIQRRSSNAVGTVLASVGLGFVLAILLMRNSDPWIM